MAHGRTEGRETEMIRLFETHHIRPVTELDGLWDFATLPGNEEDTGEYPYRLGVPGCWEQHSELATYRGRGVYRRMIRIDEAVSLRLAFKGVSHTAKVFFDGELITEHYNAYTAFTAKVRGVQPGSTSCVSRRTIHSAKRLPCMSRTTITRTAA